MKYPNQVIVGVGGTHLDFLLACFRIMVGETPILTRVGKVRIESKLREEVIGQHADGNRQIVVYTKGSKDVMVIVEDLSDRFK